MGAFYLGDTSGKAKGDVQADHAGANTPVQMTIIDKFTLSTSVWTRLLFSQLAYLFLAIQTLLVE
jgi:hypothetical protein